ncbi:hypothetical protein BXZ70DRAFT_1066558 [Cristinia sonorae]|uniref:F-box domain-containing protein n=1 Tax=Cristinia sonorae TaxID=1940300 RepID=A0A8K0UJN4_9AGAR|nr:hypothetical protein BXZ70DRAFT_1066558 [Cristinia sonorae]
MDESIAQSCRHGLGVLRLMPERQVSTPNDCFDASERSGEHELKLQWDILLYLMQFLDKPNMSRLMRTCKTLYEHGMPALIKSCHLRMSAPDDEASHAFCSFLLKSSSRPLHLRELRITDRTPRQMAAYTNGQRLAVVFAEVISQAMNLQVLHISGFKAMLAPDNTDHFRSVVEHLTNLRVIQVSPMDRLVLSVLEKIPSPLRKVILGPSGTAVEPSPLPLLHYLQPFEGTLEEIEVEPAPSGFFSYREHGIRFYHIHTLTVRLMTVTVGVTVDDLVTSFPNLRVLALYTHDFYRTREILPSTDDLLVERNLRLARRAEGWPSLDRLVCPVKWAYVSALRKVKLWERVALGPTNYLDLPEEIHRFHAVLEDIRPTHVDVIINVNRIRPADIFPTADIAHLNIDLVGFELLFKQDGSSDWLDGPMRGVVSAVKNLSRLVFLSIRLHSVTGPLQRFDDDEPIRAALTALDCEKHIHVLAQTLPNLQHVVIQFKFPDLERGDVFWASPTAAARFNKDSGNISIKEISYALKDYPFAGRLWPWL